MSDFTTDNYPTNYGSVKKGDYRLKDYANLPEKEVEKIEGDLWDVAGKIRELREPVKEYEDLEFYTAGWEFSVFKSKDGKKVIKIPAGIFMEANDPKYLENLKYAYNLVKRYYPSFYIPETIITRISDRNYIEQEFIKGKDRINKIALKFNKKLRTNLKGFIAASIKLLKEQEWVPFDIKESTFSYQFINVLIRDEDQVPLLYDFTNPYDIFRLYVQRTKQEVDRKQKIFNKFMKSLH